MRVIEFLGMPRSGKTTAIEVAEGYLKREGVKVRVIYEGARVSPLDKSDRYNYHSWSFHNTVNRILEARLDNYDFILVDRGVLDHAAFLKAIKPLCAGKDLQPALEYYLGFLNLQDRELFFDVSPEESIRREQKNKPFVGRVFNLPFLQGLSESYDSVVSYAESCGRDIHRINGNGKLKSNLEIVLELCSGLLKAGK